MIERLTDEYAAAANLREAAKTMDIAATSLQEVRGKLPKQHAKEMLGAANIARVWACELMLIHDRKQKSGSK